MFIIKMSGLYGDDYSSYFRLQGDSCFDFVNQIEYCTKFENPDDPDIKNVLDNDEWYCKLYNASKIELIKIDADNNEIHEDHLEDDESFKMKIKVFSNIRFTVIDGSVTGEIVIEPLSILNAIWSDSIFTSRDPKFLELKKLIATVNAKREQNKLSAEIILKDGVIEKNFIKMSMLRGLKLLYDYIGYEDVSSIAYHNKYAKELLEFVIKCKDIEVASQMFNVH